MLCVMAARGDKRVGAATFGVMLLDFASEAPIGAFNAKPVLSLGRRRSKSKGILPAADLANVFAWMRPNDLVWNYWANNYLMGKAPPKFDILAWSVDGTNLPGKLHEQFLDIFEHNLVATPRALTVLGVPIDLSTVRIDALVTGALTDHLTPWKACYRSTQLLGGSSTFVLSNSGHIASLVNPPGNPKASYWLGPKPGPDRGRVAERRHAAHRHLVGGLGRMEPQAKRRQACGVDRAGEREIPRARCGSGRIRLAQGLTASSHKSSRRSHE